jgi:hypothetical protein
MSVRGSAGPRRSHRRPESLSVGVTLSPVCALSLVSATPCDSGVWVWPGHARCVWAAQGRSASGLSSAYCEPRRRINRRSQLWTEPCTSSGISLDELMTPRHLLLGRLCTVLHLLDQPLGRPLKKPSATVSADRARALQLTQTRAHAHKDPLTPLPLAWRPYPEADRRRISLV